MLNKMLKLEYEKSTRYSFSKIDELWTVENLNNVQLNSYENFKEEALSELFEEFFPIKSNDDRFHIELVSKKEYGGKSFYLDHSAVTYDSIQDYKDKGLTYTAPLKLNLRVVDNVANIKHPEQEIYLTDIPLITDKGTFIVNGVERVIISQITRSPGGYFRYDKKPTTSFGNNEKVNFGEIMPMQNRGSRIVLMETKKESNKFLYVIDAKIQAGVFLKSLGLTSEDIMTIFDHEPIIVENLEDNKIKTSAEAVSRVMQQLSSIENTSDDENIMNELMEKLYSRFFNQKRYSLNKAGRYMMNKKLNLKNRVIGLTLNEDLIDEETGEFIKKGTLVTEENLKAVQNILDSGFGVEKITIKNTILKKYNANEVSLQKLKVITSEGKEFTLVGTIFNNDKKSLMKQHLTVDDILSFTNYFIMLNYYGHGSIDDIDDLGNKRVRLVGELVQNQLRIGLIRVEKTAVDKMGIINLENEKQLIPSKYISKKPIESVINEFFRSSQLSQFMDQTNPLAELTNKRRLTSLGAGGLTRDTAKMEARDVHYSTYGRVCPIESPEGGNIGLINSLAIYSKVNDLGFIETPYVKVEKVYENGRYKFSKLTKDIVWLSSNDEVNKCVGQSGVTIDEKTRKIKDLEIPSRLNGANEIRKISEIDYIEISPKQIISVATSCIPCLEHDDANRALMGSNMQRQAVPLMIPDSPIVGTGMEYYAGKYSGNAVIAKNDGVVEEVTSDLIIIKKDRGRDEYHLEKFRRTNQSTVLNQRVIVEIGDKVKAGDIIADGNAMDKGELALGKNVVVAFVTWDGYNYEDAIIVSDRLVKDDVYTSVHIEEYVCEAMVTKVGDEEITRDIPNIGDRAKEFLDKDGIVIVGTKVEPGDILVGKVSPKAKQELSHEEKLLYDIFGEKVKDVKDNSLRVKNGGEGIVQKVIIQDSKTDQLDSGVTKVVKVYVAKKRKLQAGDKMAGRHGNKGVVSRVMPREDMPYLPNGTPVDIMLNPLGVPSRMNIGQVLEMHLGIAARDMNVKVATPVFDGATTDELQEFMAAGNIAETGKTVLYDGRTGEKFDNEVTVGIMYMMKLSHMVEDKMHARSTGPYSLVTQQPLGGKAQFGGQRFGEMEVWALEAYGAANTLQEMLTIKSDDVFGRNRIYDSIVKDKRFGGVAMPESFNVLVNEMQGLGLDVQILDEANEQITIADLSEY